MGASSPGPLIQHSARLALGLIIHVSTHYFCIAECSDHCYGMTTGSASTIPDGYCITPDASILRTKLVT